MRGQPARTVLRGRGRGNAPPLPGKTDPPRCFWLLSESASLIGLPPRDGPACAPGGPPKAEPGTLTPGQRRRVGGVALTGPVEG